MKSKKMLQMMDAIDDDLIENANPQALTPKRKKHIRRISTLAACLLCAIVAINIAVFLPMFTGEDVIANGENQTQGGLNGGSQESSSPPALNGGSSPSDGFYGDGNNSSTGGEYVEGIPGTTDSNIGGGMPDTSGSNITDSMPGTSGSTATDGSSSSTTDSSIPSAPPDSDVPTQNPYADIFEKLNKYHSNDSGTADDLLPPGSGIDSSASSTYQEVTDNQVQGVIEGDLFKRTDKYIFYVSSTFGLVYYHIDQPSSSPNACYRLVEALPGQYPDTFILPEIRTRELYLSPDGKTATVIFYYEGEVRVVSIDVSDPDNATKRGEFSIKGSFVSSRLNGNKLLLLTRYSTSSSTIEKESPETYVPSYNNGQGFECIPCGCIVAPDTVTSSQYTVVTLLDVNNLEHQGTMAFLSFNGDWFVSKDNIYLTQRKTISEVLSSTDTEKTSVSLRCADIVRVNYSENTLAIGGSVTVKGTPNNQYSYDEKDGILRLVTSVRGTKYQTVYGESTTSQSAEDIITASLYCIDVNTMTVVSSVEEFAPSGETVEAVRFDGNFVYVCTAVVATATDPVFYFDLSDIYNITYKDTGVIDGYSSYLKPLGNGYLLGFGTYSNSNTKIEFYKETDTGVEIVGTYELNDFTLAGNYKSKYIDTENQIIGFAGQDYSNPYSDNQLYYKVLKYEFDDNGKVIITPVISENFPSYNLVSDARGVLIDGSFFIVANGFFRRITI